LVAEKRLEIQQRSFVPAPGALIWLRVPLHEGIREILKENRFLFFRLLKPEALFSEPGQVILSSLERIGFSQARDFSIALALVMKIVEPQALLGLPDIHFPVSIF